MSAHPETPHEGDDATVEALEWLLGVTIVSEEGYRPDAASHMTPSEWIPIAKAGMQQALSRLRGSRPTEREPGE